MASYKIQTMGGEQVAVIDDGLGAIEAARAAAQAFAKVRVGTRIEVREARNNRRVALYASKEVTRLEVEELHEPDSAK